MNIIIKEKWSGGRPHREYWLGGDRTSTSSWKPTDKDPEKSGYLRIWDNHSRSGRTFWSTWFAPNKGLNGLEMWAKYKADVIWVRQVGPKIEILAKEGTAGKLIGKGGKTIKAISAHCGITQWVKVNEATMVGGTRVIMRTRRDGERRLYVVSMSADSEFSCMWAVDGKVIAIEDNHCLQNLPSEMEGICGVNNLTEAELAVLEGGGTPPDRVVIGTTLAIGEELKSLWLLAKGLPGYNEARAAFDREELNFPLLV